MTQKQSLDKLSQTVEFFRSFFGIYTEVANFIEIDEVIKKYIEDRRGWIQRLEESEFPVAFFGAYSAGKSTIINAILGREVLPESTESTTAFPTLIRKGIVDRVVVYYIDELTKKYVFNQTLIELRNKTGLEMKKSSDQSLAQYLQSIKSDITTYEQKASVQIDKKPIDILDKLVGNWDNNKYKNSKELTIKELKDYVEGHPDSLFIDRIEVSLLDINISKDIVIVDLPGLGVGNKRHIQFTKEYIQKKANAFVVCMKPKSLLEGDDIEFLESTNKVNPTTLQRSFWVINQWDSLDQQQRIEDEGKFNKAKSQYGFKINEQRFFKISALNHFLLTCIASGTLHQTDKLKSHISNLKKICDTPPENISPDEARHLLEDDEIKEFSKFASKLFDYLNTVAKDEFIADARADLFNMTRKLRELLEPFYKEYSQSKEADVDIDAEFRNEEVTRQLDLLTNKQKQIIRKFGETVRVSGDTNVFWNGFNTTQVKKLVQERISQIDKSWLKNELHGEIDKEVSLSRLPKIVEEKIKLTLILRENLIQSIEISFIKLLSNLFLDLKNTSQEYLPESVLQILEDKLGRRDIEMRVNGLADALFYEYGDEFEKISLSSQEYEGKTPDVQIDEALQRYSAELVNLVENLVIKLNQSLRRSVKNHTRSLEEDLVKIIDERRVSISTQIFRKVKISEAVAHEVQKRDVIGKSYAGLLRLEDAL